MSPPEMAIRFCQTPDASGSGRTTSRPETTTNHGLKPKVQFVEAETISTPCLDELGRPWVRAHTDDPLDPRNWTRLQQSTILAIVYFAYFTSTYLVSVASSPSPFLKNRFQATTTNLHWMSTVPSLGLATSPLLGPILASRYGRRIVLVLGAAIALVASGCTSILSVHGLSSRGYLAARFFQGFGMGPAFNVGLAVVGDLSWEDERGVRVGLWALAGNLGLCVGGLTGQLLNTVEHGWLPYHLTILLGVLLVAELAFLPETLYPRAYVPSTEQNSAAEGTSPPRDPVETARRTKQLPFLNFAPVPGLRHPRPHVVAAQAWRAWTSPALAVSVAGFVFFQQWWIFAVLAAQTIAYEEMQPRVHSLLVTGLMLGAVLAEILFSGRMSDAVVQRLARVYDGARHPEMRLWLGYPAAILSSIGLVIWGIAVAEKWHWAAAQCGLVLYAAGVQIGTTSLATYLLDAYSPESQALAALAFYAFFTHVSAFASPWFIDAWLERAGFTWTFASQAIVCTLGILPTYFVLQKYGWASGRGIKEEEGGSEAGPE